MPDMTGQFFDIFSDTLGRGSLEMGILLTPAQMDQMARHALELEKWNRKFNLTTITDPAAMARKHFLDAIAVQPYLGAGEKRLLDMGSGAGFPGLPLKLLNGELQVLLLDASRKKVNFLKHVIRMLNLEKIKAVHGRVEDFHKDPDAAGQFDGVLARGFASLASLAGLAAPLLTPAGTIYALKGPAVTGEITPDLEKVFFVRCDPYQLPFGGDNRCLVRLTQKQKSS
ncbi:MAG: 16S rRNA (guanine(527)-N(7))-methyltransferase RsmG [Desulfotignum sp.]